MYLKHQEVSQNSGEITMSLRKLINLRPLTRDRFYKLIEGYQINPRL